MARCRAARAGFARPGRRHRAGGGQQEGGGRLLREGHQPEGLRAASQHFGNRYVQHNPGAPDGPEGLKAFLGFLKEKFPQSRSEIKRVFADGDYVILHVHAVREPGTRGSAIVDIFKLEGGKIVEHWDVVQPIPDKAANNNGMF
jgi:predicted SnoaL-like aldol condensation-catalyzing enzyme